MSLKDVDDPVITRKQAREKYFGGVGRVTLWRWERDGKLPPPIRVSNRVVGWRRSTLEGLLAGAFAEGSTRK